VIFHSLFSTLGFSNTYVLAGEPGGEAIVIDPGTFNEQVLETVEDSHCYARWVLLTHAHAAHCGGLRTLLKIYDASVLCGMPDALEQRARHVTGGESIRLGAFEFTALETPGHSMDSLCWLCGNLLFSGDALSAGRIGSTKDGYARGLLVSSLRSRVLSLPEDVLIFPGHGPPSTVRSERRFNPSLKQEL
jgi:hydroxyacylglutathione hydrolase